MAPRILRWLLLGFLLGVPAFAQSPPVPSSSRVLEIDIRGEIEPVLAEYVVQSVDSASPADYSLILITLDTPGGLDSAMRKIIRASSIPGFPWRHTSIPRVRARLRRDFSY